MEPQQRGWIIAQYATAKVGLILININPAYRSTELEHVLRTSGRRADHRDDQVESAHGIILSVPGTRVWKPEATGSS
jgi:acyl-CoA synthetase (AMP-forming)/AMP-acid ligase II